MLCVICEEGSVELIEDIDKNNVPCYYYVCKDGCGAEYADAELVRKNKESYAEYLNTLQRD